MKFKAKTFRWLPMLAAFSLATPVLADDPAPRDWEKHILTPPPPRTPRINGPSVFGARPGSPVLYSVPATGERPMTFSGRGLPPGLAIDADTGRISGRVERAGEFQVLLTAKNSLGENQKKFKLVIGDRIALTPPMGWNSWNCWAEAVDQEKVLSSAKALVESGLDQHGWTYINIDDTWQGVRGGEHNAIQPNEKFPDIKGLCDELHAMGLKAGIYSTPWVTSYAMHCGGSSDDEDGAWSKELASKPHWRIGKHAFAANDARQWADWGFDYLKYDWNPNDVPSTKQMAEALRSSGRDIVFSLSNSAPIEIADELAKHANLWRTTGDIWDYWDYNDNDWRYAVSETGFAQQHWAPLAGPGRWNDPDMLVVGKVGWGPKLHWTHLTPDQQYSHISLWCMLSAPLLIGCDLEQLDPFTLNLLSNDEVLAINQDALGKQATCVATSGAVDVYMKDLEGGGWALAIFNRGETPRAYRFNRLSRMGIEGPLKVRDLWRQKDLEVSNGQVEADLPAHGVLMLKLTPIENETP